MQLFNASTPIGSVVLASLRMMQAASEEERRPYLDILTSAGEHKAPGASTVDSIVEAFGHTGMIALDTGGGFNGTGPIRWPEPARGPVEARELASEALKERALEIHGNGDEVEIDDEAAISRGDDPGVWVAAWLWVPDEEDAEECATCLASVETRVGPCDECGAIDEEEEGEELPMWWVRLTVEEIEVTAGSEGQAERYAYSDAVSCRAQWKYTIGSVQRATESDRDRCGDFEIEIEDLSDNGDGTFSCTAAFEMAVEGETAEEAEANALALAKGEEEKTYLYTPETCPSKHHNPGDDICADCGEHLN